MPDKCRASAEQERNKNRTNVEQNSLHAACSGYIRLSFADHSPEVREKFGLEIDQLAHLSYESANSESPMENDIPEYEGSGASILVPYLAEIAALREKRWPYREISKWLREKHGVEVAHNTICDFCKNRGIAKGRPAPVPKPRSASPGQPAVAPPRGATENRQPAPPPSVPGDSSLDLLAEAEERVSQQKSNPFKTVKTSKSS